MILTLHYRIKTKKRHQKAFKKMSGAVNYVWNYCNEACYHQVRNHSKWLSEFDLNNLTSGTSKELGLSSTTLQEISKHFKQSQKTFKKLKLKWRSTKKKTLGWIPFKASAISYKDNTFKHNGISFKIFDSRYKNVNLEKIKDILKTGSINEDSKGNWFLNLQIEVLEVLNSNTKNNCIGIDLGLKDLVTCSDGNSYANQKHYYKLQETLAIAQRAKKKKQVKNIHTKIKNQRKDCLHKLTTSIVNSYDYIVVGDLHLKASKSTLSAGFGMIKSFLKYKAIKLGKTVLFVNEAWTTQQCSCCKSLTGPKGLNGLSVRDWKCCNCNSYHLRDVNAAVNILNLGLGH
jgi:putative transposase